MSRRAREQRRRSVRRSFIDRYGFRLVSVAALLGVVAIGAYLYLQATRPAYACESLLVAPAATPTPSPAVTPRETPQPTASPTPEDTPTPAPTETPEPTASGSPGATGTPPAASPTGSPSPAPEPTAAPTATAEPTPTPEPTPRLGFVTRDRGIQHVGRDRTLRFLECPPTSGPHYADSARRGFYGPDERLPAGAWIHSLEHGLVVVLYSCRPEGTACPDAATLDALRTFVDTAPQTEAAAACGIANKLIVARFDEMGTRFAAVGWNRAMLSDEYDPKAFLTFYRQWVDNAPTEEARGCDGTVGAD